MNQELIDVASKNLCASHQYYMNLSQSVLYVLNAEMATIPTSEFQVHKLIDLVRANRCLYEPLDVNHNNRAVINSVWRAISYEMCQPGNFLVFQLTGLLDITFLP